jgi:hypothetical protein
MLNKVSEPVYITATRYDNQNKLTMHSVTILENIQAGAYLLSGKEYLKTYKQVLTYCQGKNYAVHPIL